MLLYVTNNCPENQRAMNLILRKVGGYQSLRDGAL